MGVFICFFEFQTGPTKTLKPLFFSTRVEARVEAI
jgi:hypothetical protein